MSIKQHIGKVVKIENQKMTIKFDKQLGCHACEHKEACGITEESNLFDFDLIEGINIGDEVKVYVEDKIVLQSALLVYILPIFILLICAIAGNFLTKLFNLSDIFTPCFSLFGVVIYFIILKKLYGNKKTEIKIEKV